MSEFYATKIGKIRDTARSQKRQHLSKSYLVTHTVAFYKVLVEVLYVVPSDMELVFKTLFTFQTNDQLSFRAS